MARRAHDHCGLLTAAALLLLMASALAGDWCENFESGAGTFWEQRSFSGRWQASTYSQESALTTAKIPKPITGESGVLVLRPWRAGAAAASRLVSPELLVSEGGAIEITYWLWYNGAPNQVTFLLYRSDHGTG
ncbi:uncharacterized protein LOC122394683 [Amphibalanus amphitrite]|uniref:uncharacterized protein LOC122394683 n=1 Tax=Amphibalanus amphitrite TaxID=1232801 RepID=UPI001C91B11C|nr:uncharacterized protein LOC122394683 [Amphibalanus amphitrite]